MYMPPVISAVRHHERREAIETLEAKIISGILASPKGYVLIKIGTFTIEPVKLKYDISMEDYCRVNVAVGRIGIATKIIRSRTVPLENSGDLYLYATNDPKSKLLDDEITSVRMY